MKIDLLDRPRLEILNKRGPKYNLQDAEKDYFLAILLNIFYNSELKGVLVFKGGTAIYHCYLEQLRFSKDLDFTSRLKLSIDDVENLFSGFEIFKFKDAQEKKYSLDFSMQYRGVLAQSDTIEVNINTNQKVLLEPKLMEYRNYYGVKISCLVMDKNEIFAEKIRTLNDRARPRDPYDIVMLKKIFRLKVKDGLALLAKKELHKPLDRKRILENLKISLDRLDDEMKELYYRQTLNSQELKDLANELSALLK